MRFDKRLAAVFGFVILAGSVVFADEKQVVKLTLDDAVEYALKNSRTLKSSDIDLEMKKRASSTSWNVFLPNVQATGTMSRANDYNPSTTAMAQMGSTLSWLANDKQGVPATVATDYENEEDRWSTIGG